jgi:hypothetical protein
MELSLTPGNRRIYVLYQGLFYMSIGDISGEMSNLACDSAISSTVKAAARLQRPKLKIACGG